MGAEADGASPFSEETSFTPLVEEPSTAPKAAKVKQKIKKARGVYRDLKKDEQRRLRFLSHSKQGQNSLAALNHNPLSGFRVLLSTCEPL